MRCRCDENHRYRTSRLIELGNLRKVGGANRSASAHARSLRERRIDAGERDAAARNFDAGSAGLRVDSPGRIDRAADALELIALNRLFDQSFARRTILVIFRRRSGGRDRWLESKGLLPSAGALLVLLQ